MKKSFGSVTVVATIALITTVVAGGSFAAYKYHSILKEKDLMQLELIEQKEREIERLTQEQQNSGDIASTTPNESKADPVDEELNSEMAQKPEVREIVKTVVEYVPASIPVQTTDKSVVETQPVVEEKVSVEADSESVEIVQSPEVSPAVGFVIRAVRQTAFPDGYGGVYGGYEIEIDVTAPSEGDVYIPQTTTNTIGASSIAFSYTVNGDNFRGIEDSQVTCSIKRDNNCRIKAGQTSTVTTTIWLYPDSESNGNYSVTFDDLQYLYNGDWQTFVIDRTTSRINLMY